MISLSQISLSLPKVLIQELTLTINFTLEVCFVIVTNILSLFAYVVRKRNDLPRHTPNHYLFLRVSLELFIFKYNIELVVIEFI